MTPRNPTSCMVRVRHYKGDGVKAGENESRYCQVRRAQALNSRMNVQDSIHVNLCGLVAENRS
jgi:hypothetical protein